MEKLSECVIARLWALEGRFLDRCAEFDGRTGPYPYEEVLESARACKSEGQQSRREDEADPIKLFIKDEPHTRKKIKAGRYRLISALSLVDQVVDRILFYPWVQSEIKNCMSVTSKGGWTPLPAGYASLVRRFPEGTAVAVDKTCWDWTMPQWVVQEYYWAKFRQCQQHRNFRRYKWVCWRRLRLVLGPDARFQLPGGTIWRQTEWGIMKSGFLLTLSLNGAAQFFQHALAWNRMGNITYPPLIWTMGDDTIMRMPVDKIEAYKEQLATTGCIVKFVSLAREFSGYRFVGMGDNVTVAPLYEDKHRFIVSYLEPEKEKDVITAFTLLYALDRPGWLDVIAARAGVRRGLTQKLWARGLLKVDMLKVLPDWTKF